MPCQWLPRRSSSASPHTGVAAPTVLHIILGQRLSIPWGRHTMYLHSLGGLAPNDMLRGSQTCSLKSYHMPWECPSFPACVPHARSREVTCMASPCPQPWLSPANLVAWGRARHHVTPHAASRDIMWPRHGQTRSTCRYRWGYSRNVCSLQIYNGRVGVNSQLTIYF